MVRIRLARYGLKRQPVYRIVVTDGRKARNGKEIEVLGYYNPRTRPSTDVVDEARALYWLSVGAQPSDAVVNIFNRTGTMSRFERMKQGESVEALVAEAEANRPEVSPRTSYPAPAPGEGKGPRAQERANVTVEEAEAE
ncbi:MAG: 30S ribosomal protein S16 [Phototrophicales bacterium]|nr:MAG: 30S ribosomal protein S16 [Phototrophicales bacterium]RMG71535.1 MAG: 30S ribosomal protein S16 [Chloroflexota bacterium]